MARHYMGLDYPLAADQLLLGDDDILGADLLDQILQGDDELMGEDNILGAELMLGRDARKLAAARAMARGVAARNARVVAPKVPLAPQTQVMPFPATAVLTTATVDITARPQRTFRTERLVVSSSIAAFFRIAELKIGRESMLVAAGGVAAQVFAEVGVGVRLMGYTANLGNDIVITVTNTDADTQTFDGAIIGSTIVNP